jgi:uncharacterized protein YccT (UPF0319 family)
MFNTRRIAAGILFFCTMTPTVQAATFEVPRSFEIMYVDLQGARQYGNDFKVSLDEGAHQIVIRFNKLLRSGGDTTLYQSEPIILDLTFNKDDYFTLEAPYISKTKQAESYSKMPEFEISDERSSKAVTYEKQMLPTQSGLQNTRDYLSEIERLTSKNTSKALTGRLVFDVAPSPAPLVMEEDVDLDMMKFWYNQSDDATRKAIRVLSRDRFYQPQRPSIQFDMSQFWYEKADTNERTAFQHWLTN